MLHSYIMIHVAVIPALCAGNRCLLSPSTSASILHEDGMYSLMLFMLCRAVFAPNGQLQGSLYSCSTAAATRRTCAALARPAHIVLARDVPLLPLGGWAWGVGCMLACTGARSSGACIGAGGDRV